ncbi:gsr3265 [Gloeobacter violaceus PCC 7421]|uniref:Gsr3265 protein n=1 Tax=Gloeobacter violaceus (strain ATCC 29082 / PCC 7421) TaxID=251221 RepID=Q7NGA7_GLOVI|nr:gsr3265 [Gloeobacter violaceus PCC 7421]
MSRSRSTSCNVRRSRESAEAIAELQTQLSGLQEQVRQGRSEGQRLQMGLQTAPERAVQQQALEGLQAQLEERTQTVDGLQGRLSSRSWKNRIT